MTEKRKPGRPSIAEGKRMTVNLDAPTVARARELGDGNISRGIRKAVATLTDAELYGRGLQVRAEPQPEPVEAPNPAGPTAQEPPVV